MCSLKISLARCCAYFEVSLPLVAMPFQKKEADKKYVKAVPVFKLFTKAKLRSYADSNGCLLLCGEQGTAPAKHFKIKEVREQLSSENSELVNRPAMGINLTAATISGGAEVLPFLSDPQVSNNVTLDVLSTCDMFLCNNIGGGSRRLPPLQGGLGGRRTLNPKTKFDGWRGWG